MPVHSDPAGYLLTNEHGLRLALSAGRVGFLSHAVSAALDAADAMGGFPVLVGGPIPSEVEGCRGPVVALEYRRAAANGGPVVLERPVPMAELGRAIFPDAVRMADFRAGLPLVGIPDPGPRLRATPELFQGSLRLDDLARPPLASAERWRRRLDRQERISAAVLVGDLVAAGTPWPRDVVDGLRSAGAKGTSSPEAELFRLHASAVAAVEALGGWSAAQLVKALDEKGVGDFAGAYMAASDPFADEEMPEPGDELDRGVAFLLDHSGAAASSLIPLVLEAEHRLDPLSAALVGIFVGRPQVPLHLRNPEDDQVFVMDEIQHARPAEGNVG